MSTWRLRAHGTARVPASAEDVAAAAMLPELVRVEAFDGALAHVRAASLVGVASAGALRVEVNAGALSRSAVLAMAGAHGRFALRGYIASDSPDADLFSVIARAFCDAAARLVSRGLVREYAEREGRFDTIRGELVLDRWFGPASPDGGSPICRVRERTLNIPEHRMLLWALRWVARDGLLPKATRLRAGALAARVGVDDPSPPSPVEVRSLRRGGLFAAYAESVDLSELIWLGVTGGQPGQARVRGFLLDADRLYERWVLGLVGRGLPAGWSAQGGVGWSLTAGDERINRVMDTVILDDERRRVAIIDAKNKDLAEGTPDRNDVHQLVAYMATTGCRQGYLVGVGAVGPACVRRWSLRGGVGQITVVALPGAGDVGALEEAGRAWWSEELATLAGRAEPPRSVRLFGVASASVGGAGG